MSSTDYSKELAKMFQNDSFAQAYVNTTHLPSNFEETAPVPDFADDIATTRNAVHQHVSSPLRRPTTRSQTGIVTRRRPRDDAQLIEVRKRAVPARKRQKTPTDAQGSSTPDTQDSTSPKPPPTREASLSSTSSAPNLLMQPPQLTFYHSSISELDQPQTCHPRSRASLPTPIPNLTKKSRGRRVPTKDATIADPNQKDNRLYVCTVEGCGKCFHRGEHLKRHIRSIHTHEKPFRCTFSLCEKYFNRHDNLLQHLKVHRQANSLPDHPPLFSKRTSEGEQCDATSVSPLLPHRHHRNQRSCSPDEDEDEDERLAPPASPPARPRTIYDAFPPRYTPFSAPSTASAPSIVYNHLGTNNFNGNNSSSNLAPVDDASMHGNISANQTMSILANVAVSSLRMEVSSLRTELPQSPVDMRPGFGAMQLSPC